MRWKYDFELIEVQGDNITASQIVWRRYRVPARGVLEIFLDMNPEIATHFRESPFLPVGAVVRMPIIPAILQGKAPLIEQVRLYGTG